MKINKYKIYLLILIIIKSSLLFSLSATENYNKGVEFLKNNNYELSEKYFKYAVKLDDEMHEAYYNLAVIKYRTDRYSEALYYISEVYKSDKGFNITLSEIITPLPVAPEFTKTWKDPPVNLLFEIVVLSVFELFSCIQVLE